MDPISLVQLSTSAAQAFQATFKAMKALAGMVHDAEITAALVDINQKLLDHQAAHIGLIEEYKRVLDERDALKKELLELKQFKANRDRYVLKCLGSDTMLYVLREAAANGEDPHWLCPDCMKRGEVGFVQRDPDDAFLAGFPGEQGNTHLVCLACKQRFTIPTSAFNAAWGKYA